MNIRVLFAQILMGTLLLGGVFGPGVALAVDPKAKTCKVETVSASSIPTETERKSMEKLIETNKKINEAGKNDSNFRPLGVEVTKTTCGSSVTYNVPGGLAGETTALPQIFTKDKATSPCWYENLTLECSVKKAPSSSGNTPKPTGPAGISESSFRLPICELVEQAIVSGGGDKELQTYACSELMDPLPSNFFKGNSDTKCVSRTTSTDGKTTYKITDSKDLSGTEYCNAILSKTDGGFGALFAFVRLMYDISLPILVALAVISLVGLGVFIMYAPNGGEDTLKKAKDMAIRIASGFLLLLLMRVFLGFISFDLFGKSTDNAIPASSTTNTLKAKQ